MLAFCVHISPSIGSVSVVSNHTSVDVNGTVLVLLEIRTFFPALTLGPNAFAIEAVFNTSNITFVSANQGQIASAVFGIYDRQRIGMKANTLETRLSGQDAVILSIDGTYDNSKFLDDLLRLLWLEKEYSQFSNEGTWRVSWTTWMILGGILLFIIVGLVLCCVCCAYRHRHSAHSMKGTNVAYEYVPEDTEYHPSAYPPARE